jgi:hypothetical protein
MEQQGEGFHAVLVPAAGAVLITNDTGRQLLELCDGRRTRDDIAAEFAAGHPDAPAADLARDVEEFLRVATEKGALTW